MAPGGTLIAEWKGPEPGFYGPRRIAIGPDDSIYVVDQGHNWIARFSSNGRRRRSGAVKVLATANLTILRRSQSIQQPTEFTSPIR